MRDNPGSVVDNSFSRVHRCLEPGQSVFVGTVGADGMPATCRAIALTSDDNLKTLTVYVPIATSHTTVQNVAATKRLAVTATNPHTNAATQLKGTSMDVRLARDSEREFIRERLNAFADMLDGSGVPRRLTHSVAHWPAFAIRLRVEHIFEQTPGPNAGTPLR
jgi:hypothetical protein